MTLDSKDTPIKDKGQQADGLDNGSDDTSEDITLESSKAKIEEIPEEYRDKVEEIRKGFQRSYTKSKQVLAQKEKDLEDKVKKSDEWERWYSEHKPSIEAYNANLTDFSDYLKKKRDGISDEVDHVKEDDSGDITSRDINMVKKMAIDASRSQKDFEQKAGILLDMLVTTQSLMVSKYKDLNVDPKKVMTYAQKRGIVDMEDAIKGAYSDEIKEVEFAKRLEEEKEKWQTQSSTNVLSANMPMGKTVRKVLARERGKR